MCQKELKLFNVIHKLVYKLLSCLRSELIYLGVYLKERKKKDLFYFQVF